MDRFANAVEAAIDRIWPKSRQGQVIFVGTTVAAAAIILRPLAVHYALGRQVRHTYPNRSARAAAAECGEISSLPPNLLEHPEEFRTVHDKVEKHAAGFHASPSFENGELFTKILRSNMDEFSKTTQSYLIKRALPDRRVTFEHDYINQLNFQEGDVVCGSYTVVKRTPLRCELSMSLPKDLSPVQGILAIRVSPSSNGAIFISEVVQWVGRSTGVVLPLERWLLHFMHSTVSRRLALGAAAILENSVPLERR